MGQGDLRKANAEVVKLRAELAQSRGELAKSRGVAEEATERGRVATERGLELERQLREAWDEIARDRDEIARLRRELDADGCGPREPSAQRRAAPAARGARERERPTEHGCTTQSRGVARISERGAARRERSKVKGDRPDVAARSNKRETSPDESERE